MPRPEWVARPDRNAEKFSNHNCGLALDLSFEVAGVLVDMGSGCDEFTERSVYDFPEVSAQAQKNRALLRGFMQDAKFVPYNGEWWHFAFPGQEKALDYPI